MVDLTLSNEGEVDLKVRLRVHQTLSVDDPQRSEAQRHLESDSGTDSPGRHLDAAVPVTGETDGELGSDRAPALDLALFPHEARIPARSHKRIVARVDLHHRAFYRFAISYEAIKFLRTLSERAVLHYNSVLLDRKQYEYFVHMLVFHVQVTSRTWRTCCRRRGRR